MQFSPRFNTSQNMQKFQPQTPGGNSKQTRGSCRALAKADLRSLRQPGLPLSPPARARSGGSLPPGRQHRTAATSQKAPPQRSALPLSPLSTERAHNSNLYFARYKSELFSMMIGIIHSHTHTHKKTWFSEVSIGCLSTPFPSRIGNMGN